MNEDEWPASKDPQAMLEAVRGKVSDRKLRLFACACVRQIWHLLTDEQCRNAVEVAERFADGLATDSELNAVRATARDAAGDTAWDAAGDTAWDAAGDVAWTAARTAARTITGVAAWAAAWDAAWDTQSNLLRDIIGNPFWPTQLAFQHDGKRPAEGFTVSGRLVRRAEHSSHLYEYADRCVWLTPNVLSLAAAVYEGRDPANGHLDPVRLGILADSLEEAGCGGVLLAHLRSPGPHVRGCWAVDLVLGKD
jgi:hypothetical protein